MTHTTGLDPHESALSKRKSQNEKTGECHKSLNLLIQGRNNLFILAVIVLDQLHCNICHLSFARHIYLWWFRNLYGVVLASQKAKIIPVTLQ